MTIAVAPTLQDVYRAKRTIAPHLSRTPLNYSLGLSEVLDADVYLKHDEYLPLGAFKARGGFNLLANLSDEEKARGVVTASSGNHGQSIAAACAAFGVRAVVVLPEGANRLKAAALESLGAEVVYHGKYVDQSIEHGERLAAEEGSRYVHPANEPLLIAGVATQALEVVEDLPGVEYMFVPLGGGSTASGACIAAKGLNPQVKVIAVQSEAAPGGYLSWKHGELVTAPMETVAEGVATASGFELPQGILREMLDDFVLVSDEDMLYAIGLLLEKAHTLAEAAGAAATAGALKCREAIRGKKVSITVSGANITLEQLTEAVKVYQERGGPGSIPG